MKSDLFKFLGSIILFAGLLLSQSCKNEWDNHYKNELKGSGTVMLANYIHMQPDLSTFYKMLTLTGYDTILNQSQTYTVWAPTNDALQNVDLTDTKSVLDIVKNHIARFSISTSNVYSQPEYVKMLNGKLIQFSLDNSGYQFGGCALTSSDMLVANGILHVISSYEPFLANIWEYINRTPGLDSMNAYLKSQVKKVFYPDASIELYVDSLGNRIYDSVFIETNVFLNKIGHINTEDSIYTAILPNNTAWNEAYDRIKNYYVSAHATKAAQIQRENTMYSLVKDLVFRGRISSPSSNDSVVSTTGNVFLQPSYLFNAASTKVSNGLVYVSNALQYKATDSWHKTIRIEAESTDGRSNTNSNIYTRYSYGSGLSVSNKTYILVDPTVANSSVSKVNVIFTIPGTLSAKYNIYCVFVPTSIVTPTDLRPYKPLFFISYVHNVNGQPVYSRDALTVTNSITNPNTITKMLIAKNFQFPYSHVDSDEKSSEVVTIQVQNNVAKESTLYSRQMRIDCILLEPVTE
jgi:uncharacterized surface protein with fasciclin (FAS1) repeats